MLKHIVILVALSLLAILFMSYAQQGLQYLVDAHDWIDNMLKEVFSGGQAGNISRELLALLAIPVGIALIPTIIYWLAKRQWFPYFIDIVWIIWFMQTAALIVLYKAPTA